MPTFEQALNRLADLGALFVKYEIAAQASLPITEDIFAHIFPRERGTRLALLEIAQIEGRHDDAMAHIERLMDLDPTDPVVLLSFVELALDTPDDRYLMDRVVRATVHVENETPVDTAILLYRGRALAALGLPDAAIDVFTLANRRRKDRPDGLLHQIRYDRAVLYHETGQRARARRQFERIYAADPDFEDVAARLKAWGDDDRRLGAGQGDGRKMISPNIEPAHGRAQQVVVIARRCLICESGDLDLVLASLLCSLASSGPEPAHRKKHCRHGQKSFVTMISRVLGKFMAGVPCRQSDDNRRDGRAFCS